MRMMNSNSSWGRGCDVLLRVLCLVCLLSTSFARVLKHETSTTWGGGGGEESWEVDDEAKVRSNSGVVDFEGVNKTTNNNGGTSIKNNGTGSGLKEAKEKEGNYSTSKSTSMSKLEVEESKAYEDAVTYEDAVPSLNKALLKHKDDNLEAKLEINETARKRDVPCSPLTEGDLLVNFFELGFAWLNDQAHGAAFLKEEKMWIRNNTIVPQGQEQEQDFNETEPISPQEEEWTLRYCSRYNCSMKNENLVENENENKWWFGATLPNSKMWGWFLTLPRIARRVKNMTSYLEAFGSFVSYFVNMKWF